MLSWWECIEESEERICSSFFVWLLILARVNRLWLWWVLSINMIWVILIQNIYLNILKYPQKHLKNARTGWQNITIFLTTYLTWEIFYCILLTIWYFDKILALFFFFFFIYKSSVCLWNDWVGKGKYYNTLTLTQACNRMVTVMVTSKLKTYIIKYISN